MHEGRLLTELRIWHIQLICARIGNRIRIRIHIQIGTRIIRLICCSCNKRLLWRG